MAIIPNNTQFIGDTTGIPIQEKRSAQVNALSTPFTMADIIETVGVGDITGSGTINKVPKFISSGVLADGLLNDDGISVWNSGAANILTNTSFGKNSLNSITTGNQNTSFGNESSPAITTGTNNVSFGFQSLKSNIVGSNNASFGTRALSTNTGNFNSAFGRDSLFGNTSGVNNSGFGGSTLVSNTTGSANTAVGYQSLNLNLTGSSNSALGFNTQSGNFSNSVILGANAVSTANNQFVVGAVGTIAGAVTAEVNTSANVWNVVINGVARKILLA
jgi:hypothetical protein